MEKELEQIYVTLLLTKASNEKEVKRAFNQLLGQAKINCKKLGITENENWSESFIELMNTTNNGLSEIEKRRKYYIDVRKNKGVTESDIRSWWDLHYLERAFIVELDNFFKTKAVLIDMDKGLSIEEAAKKIRKAFVTYGEPINTKHTTGDNRPLPYELKDRIDRYIEKRAKEDPEALKSEKQNYETFNAFIKSEMRKGNI